MTTNRSSTRPLPVPDTVNGPYWRAAREHRFVLMRCTDCQKYVHPPRPTCPRCQSAAIAATTASGRGTVYSFGVMHRGGNPGFEDDLPYAVLVVELAEEPLLFAIGNVVDCPLEAIEIGMPVEVVFEDLTDEISLPQWRPSVQVPA
ncbi:MAG: OB-fold domain-containing protein [Ilumatobacteraceae bacterium]